MIITSIFRSGGTKFAYDKSLETGLPFKGEVDYTSLKDFERIDKNKFHELGVQPEMTFSELIDAIENHEKYIILNNHANPALFSKTDYFITRRNLESSYYSIASFVRKQYPGFAAMHAHQLFMTHTFQIGLIHTYLADHSIIPLYFEDLFPDSKTVYEIANDVEYQNLVKKNMELLHKHGVI